MNPLIQSAGDVRMAEIAAERAAGGEVPNAED
jgi:hypothetical protein